MLLPGFVGGSYQSDSATVDSERTINWYVERTESPGATAQQVLYPIPGMSEIADGVTGPGRAHFEEDGREFAVIGTTLWEIASNGTKTSRGTVAIDSNPATISSNGDGGGELWITSGTNGYIFDLTANTLTQIAAMNGKATMGGHLDGYFLTLDASTSTLWVSDLLDGTTWSGTQFLQRSDNPDPWIGMKVVHRYVWLFGQDTSTVMFDSGASPFPLEIHPAGVLPWGCAAAFSPAELQGAVYWLGASEGGHAMVLRATGFTPDRISTHPLQKAIEGLASISDATGDVYEDRGHTFYLLSIPDAKITYVWDDQSRLWCERGTWLQDDREYGVWRPQWHAHAFGEHRWLDSGSGKVYKSDHSVGTDADGTEIRRLRRTPPIQFEGERMFFSSLELDLETGLGLQTGQGSDPQVSMRSSNDGGRQWSSEAWRSAGKVGKYLTRVRWNRQGAARRRVYEFVVSDPIPWRLANAYLTMGQPPTGLSQVEQANWGG